MPTATVIRPGILPSYNCAKDAGILDAAFVRQVDRLVFIQRENHIIGGGADAYMAGAPVKNLKGIGAKLANHLGSRKFNGGAGIHTIGELASYVGGFGARLQELTPHQVELMETLRAALTACRNPAPGRVGPRVTVSENDPAMRAEITPGKEVMGYNQGRDGHAEVVISGDPSDNGFAISNFTLDFSPFGTRTRSGGFVEHAGFQVSVIASESTMATAERMRDALADRGLQAEIERLPELMFGLPQHPVQIRVWSPRVID